MPLSKLLERVSPRVNPNINHKFRVTMMLQCRLINCNKCTIWWGIVIIGEAMLQRQGTYGKSVYFPLNFVMNLKVLQK